MSMAHQIAAYAVQSSCADLPAEVRERGRQVIFDQLGCIVVGSEMPAGSIMVKYVEAFGGYSECTVVGTQRKVPPALAALANGTSGSADEFDSVHSTSDFLSTGHPAAVIVPAALAAAERQSSTGAELLNAVILGYDIGSRTVSATGGLPGIRSNHGLYGGALHGIGAAFACAKLLGLDERRHLYAGSIAAGQCVSLNAFFGESRHMGKALVEGQAAYAGMSGALMAAEGFEGNENIFESQDGILDTWAATDRRHELVNNLGTDFAVMGTNLKFYSAAYGAHSSIEAVLDLLTAHHFGVNEIDRVVVRIPSFPASIVNDRSMPTFSLQYMVAVALVAGRLGFDEAHSAALVVHPDVLRLKSIIELVSDADYEPSHPRGAAVHIYVNGQILERVIDHPRGHRFREPPASWDDLLDKWQDLLSRRIGKPRFAEFYHSCLNLESLDSARDLIRPLVIQRSS
jgi:2-methylcitrate dehydratase PrpD